MAKLGLGFYTKSILDSDKVTVTILCHFSVVCNFTFSKYREEKRSYYEYVVDFMLGWYLHPLTYGEYPASMRELVGSRLPKFTKRESERVKESFDFLGLNYYTSFYSINTAPSEHPSYTTDANVNQTSIRNGIPIVIPTGSDDFFIYPKGLQELLRYIKRNYKDPLIFITENGVSEKNNETLSVSDACNDVVRKVYHHDHLRCLKKAISEDETNVLGYFAWSFMDDFEWSSGYSVRFGLYYVDFKNNLTRHEKYSAKWLKSILTKDTNKNL